MIKQCRHVETELCAVIDGAVNGQPGRHLDAVLYRMSLLIEKITQCWFWLRQVSIPIAPFHGDVSLIDRNDYALRLDGF